MPKSNLEKDLYFIGLVKAGKLKVSRAGKVVNVKTGRRIGYPTKDGYYQISYCDPATKIIWKMLIHRLVWLAFRGPIPQGMEINHRDLNRANPNLKNLEPTSSYGNNWYSRNGGSYDAHLAQEYEWVSLIRRGWSCNDLGRKFGLAASSISRRLKKYDLGKIYPNGGPYRLPAYP
jgi:hypothetical protein